MTLLTFILVFVILTLVMLGMAFGVMASGKTIKGSCGGLNAISGADKCVVCKKDVDPDSPLKDRLQCPRAKQMLDQMAAD